MFTLSFQTYFYLKVTSEKNIGFDEIFENWNFETEQSSMKPTKFLLLFCYNATNSRCFTAQRKLFNFICFTELTKCCRISWIKNESMDIMDEYSDAPCVRLH